MTGDWFEHLVAKRRIATAELAALVARADQRRAASADLRTETEKLLAELECVVSRTGELQRRCNGRPPALD